MKPCAYDDCTGLAHAKGYCPTHYQRFKRYGSADLPERAKAECLAAGCTSSNYSNGLCIAHYQRLRSTGLLDLPSVVERLVVSYQVAVTGCWLWTPQPDANGYGRISINDRVQYAHRVSWETFIGPIPEGLTIDHLCRVRRCINPAHLEPVTLAENVRREMSARRSQ
jgi:hypothetical protein